MSHRAERLEARAHEVRERAQTIARSIAAEAAGVTTEARERAILRLFGVDGLDRAGRPLAQEVVQRFTLAGPALLAGGVALPLALAALDYDLSAPDMAREIAGGYVDPALEAAALGSRPQRFAAERHVATWIAEAVQRLDANRTARIELRDLFGDGREPWLGTHLPAGQADEASRALSVLVEAGADLVRVDVPRDRELRAGLGDMLDEGSSDESGARASVGSQRGLGVLRDRLDDAAARSGRFLQLATRTVGLAAPEAAVVAGFERVDILFSDPLEGILQLGIDPARAFADQQFCLELLRLGGAAIAVGPGPIVVAPELSRGEPLEPWTRSGRALALQALNVELARAAGVGDDRIYIGALPADLFVDLAAVERGAVELELRRLLFPGSGLVLEEPSVPAPPPDWPVALPSLTVGGAAPRLVIVAGDGALLARRRGELDTGRRAAEGLSRTRAVGPLGDVATGAAGRALEVAIATLRLLTSEGWDPLLHGGRGSGVPAGRQLGASGLVARQGYFDVLDAAPAMAGATLAS